MDLVRTVANSLANPRVLFAWQPEVALESAGIQAGFYQPFSTMSFRILRPDGTEYLGSTAVDPTDAANQFDADEDGRIIVLPFTIDVAEPVGTYTAEVTFVVQPSSGAPLPAQTVTFPFRVLDEAQGWEPNVYAQLQDMLDAGFPVAAVAPLGGYTFVQGRAAIQRASRFIEQITQRVFLPTYGSHDHDGEGGALIQTEHVIIGLTRVAFTYASFSPSDSAISESDLRVYNRHIRQNLARPDDREDPRVEFLRSSVERYPRSYAYGSSDLLFGTLGFVESQQNVQMRGMWGYTDYDGSPFGKTPSLIVELTLRLAARYIGNLWTQLGGAGAHLSPSGPLSAERTLDQSVSFANLSVSHGAGAYAGAFTGDPEIDQLLALHMAPPKLRSA